jgi:hypothetical protein
MDEERFKAAVVATIAKRAANSGTHKLSLTFDLPDDWSEELAKAMADARRELLD